MGDRGGRCSYQKDDDHKSKIACKGNEDIYLREVRNWRGYIVALFWEVF